MPELQNTRSAADPAKLNKQLGIELQAERTRWRDVIQGLADEVWVCDPNGSTTVLDLRSRSDVTGELPSRPLSEMLSNFEILDGNGEPRAPEQSPLMRALRGEVVHTEEILKHRKSAGIRYREVSSAPTRDPKGTITGAVAIVRDITARKRSERETSELRDRLAVELGAMLWLHELSSRLVQLNDLHPLLEEILDAAIQITSADMGCIQLLHVATGTLKMAAERRLAPPYAALLDDTTQRKRLYSTVLATRERVIVDDVAISRSSAVQEASSAMLAAGIHAFQTTPLCSREGRVVGILCTHYRQPRRPTERDLRLLDLLARQAADLIDRAQSEQAMRESEERLRLTAQVAHIGIFDTRSETGQIFWSDELKSIVGVPTEYVPRFPTPGQDPSLVHTADRERVAESMAEVCTLRGDGRIEQEYRIVRPDGATHWIIVRGRVFLDEVDGSIQPVRTTGTVFDITDRKLAEAALLRTEKLASVGRMAATVAHEINNPLAAITNAVYLAASDPTLSERTRGRLDIAQHELERVANLARQTLGFYKGTSSTTRFRLSAVADGVTQLYETKLKNKGVLVERSYVDDDYVSAISGEIRQIISNLLSNAIDAVERDGRISLRTMSSSSVNISHRMVGFTIADNGIGISSAERTRVFEPFFTTKEVIGTGLGLWVTKELITKANGSIQVRSRPGKGTVFRLWLPADETAQQSALLAQTSPSVQVA